MKQMIYADNAATTKLDPKAFEAMKPYLLEEYGNASQPYSFAREPKKALAEARSIIASCIGAASEEIYFTSGGTEADNWAIKGSAFCNTEAWTTVTSSIEHHAILKACAAIEKQGYPIAYLSPDETGVISPETLSNVITDRTKLVSIMVANNEIGTIEPIAELAAIAHAHGAIFHTDAVQAVGHIVVDVKAMDVDLMSASAHKFNGPKGIGFLYVKKGTEILPLLDGGAQEFGRRAGTENIAAIVGMAAALQENCNALESNRQRILSMEKTFLCRLGTRGIDFKRNGGANTLPGILSLSFEGLDGEVLLHRLDLMGIVISTGAACDSVKTEISHVLRAIKLDEKLAKGTVRISIGKNNTEDEVLAIADAIARVAKID